MLSKISLPIKHFILIGISAIGFIVITFISYNSLKELKKELDTVYFGNIVQANNLMNISDTFSHDILNSLHKFQNSLIKKEKLVLNLQSASEIINDLWFEYASRYHTKKESTVINKIQKKIVISLDETKLLIWKLQNKQKIYQRNIYDLYRLVEPSIKSVNSLISYEFSQANIRKKRANLTYQKTIRLLFFTLGSTFVLIIIVFMPILKNIEKNHKKLEELNKQLKTISITDSLTQIYNRRYFDLILANELNKAIRDKKSLAFAMIDIDNFKKYNDFYGHDEGDEALKSVAKELNKDLRRASDYVFRLGGEEFGVLTVGMEFEKAKLFFENLREKIEALDIEHEKNTPKKITISIGVCYLKENNSTEIKKLIKKADEMLYKSKENGRNQINITVV